MKAIRTFKMKKGLKHPNIVETVALYIDLSKKKTYMVIELVEGQNLMEILSKGRKFEGNIN